MQWHPENLLNFLLGVIILSSNNYDFLVLECNLWYCMVAFFAALSTVGGKSYLCAGPPLCNSVLTVIILPSVSLGSRLGLNAVLFFLMSENTLSSSALECGMVRTKRAIDESLGNWLCPSALFMARMEFQMTSALYFPSLVWDFASSLTDAGMSSSSSMTKSLNSCESSSISKAEQYGNRCGYLKLKSSRQGSQMQTLK